MSRTALIVGASRGLGLGLARELASRGWRVIATARKPDQAGPLQTLAAGSNGRVTVEAIDIVRPEHLEALAARLSTKLDLLFVNAGISGPAGKTMLDATREEVADVLWTNAIAPLRVANRLLPQVVDGGTVAFMSSVMGSVGENTFGGHDLYRMSKGALNMLARNFELAIPRERRIAVLCLHPGWVRTDMGGSAAPLGIEESVRGLANVLEAKQAPSHRYLDYTGREMAW
jgi:NAD(P)-dependent dehydrogenase (short-subunit alcohol dehydrogenase family)